jgi:hypothetical protein
MFVSSALAQDSHPDLNGVWTLYMVPGESGFGPMAGPPLPLKKAAKAKVDEYAALVAPDSDNPGAHCLGTGMPGSMLGSGPYPMEIIQQPNRITIIYEAHQETRRIFFGNDVIAPADRPPSRNGYSIGHWDGDTLVVETDTLREQVDQRFAHSEQAKIVERYHLTTDSAGNRLLQDDMTLTDPVYYSKPVSATKKWAFLPKGYLLPYECDEEGWLDHLDQLKAQADAAKTGKAKP